MASKQVMDLEAHLGLRLLNRTTRRVSLTDEGAGYLERCRDILSAIDEAEQEFASRALEPSGRLRVTAPMSFGASHLAPQIALYAARNPRVSVELILNDRHVDLVEEGFDLAIRIGRLADSSLVAKKIGEMRLMACAAPSYLSARGRPQTPGDFADHECVLYSYASAGAVWNFTGPAGRESVRVGGRVVCNNGEAFATSPSPVSASSRSRISSSRGISQRALWSASSRATRWSPRESMPFTRAAAMFL
jgi:DNA-binding transcriptional LysR family regulator